MKTLLLLLLLCHISSSVKHTLQSYITASSGLKNLPEYSAVTVVDDIQTIYCERSNRILELKQDWTKKVYDADPEQFNFYDERCFSVCPHLFQFWISSLKKRYNQSEGVHILQLMQSSEWDDETGEVTGFWQYGYNGEDLLSFDLKTLTWVAPKPHAVLIKMKWDAEPTRMKHNVWLVTQSFPKWLKMFVENGNTTLMRKALPSVSLLQKTPSSAVSCHATGFYPVRAMMFWRKDGEEIHEGVEHGDILPNHDGSFQMNVDLDVSSVSDWGKYDCVFHLSGFQDIVTKLDKNTIRSNEVNPLIMIIGIIVAAVILVAVAVIGFIVYKKKTEKQAPSPAESGESQMMMMIPQT